MIYGSVILDQEKAVQQAFLLILFNFCLQTSRKGAQVSSHCLISPLDPFEVDQ